MVEFQKTAFANEVLLFFDNRIDVEVAANDETFGKDVRRFDSRQAQSGFDDAFAEVRIVSNLLTQFIGNALEHLQHEFVNNCAIREIEIDHTNFFFEFGGKFERRTEK